MSIVNTNLHVFEFFSIRPTMFKWLQITPRRRRQLCSFIDLSKKFARSKITSIHLDYRGIEEEGVFKATLVPL